MSSWEGKERIWINPSSCWGMDYGVWFCESLHCVPPIEALLMKFWCRPLVFVLFLVGFFSHECFLFADLEHFRWRVTLQKFLGEFNHVGHRFVFWDQVRAGDLELQIQVLSWKFLRIGVSLMSTDYCVLISSGLEIFSCKSRFWSRDFPHMRMPGLDFFWGMSGMISVLNLFSEDSGICSSVIAAVLLLLYWGRKIWRKQYISASWSALRKSQQQQQLEY
jgi:hypothetical protein